MHASIGRWMAMPSEPINERAGIGWGVRCSQVPFVYHRLYLLFSDRILIPSGVRLMDLIDGEALVSKILQGAPSTNRGYKVFDDSTT